MTTHRYDPVSLSLHWFTAFAVIAAYAIGLGREALPKGDFRTALLGLHMSLGMLVMVLAIVRITWRSLFAAPVAPVTSSHGPADLAAKFAHLALYGTMLAIPVIGLLAAWTKGRPVDFFGLMALPSPIGLDRALAKGLENAHEIAGHLMMALAGIHALAAIGHQFILKDGTLSRMLPGGRLKNQTHAA